MKVEENGKQEPIFYQKPDLHLHSACSDGTDTPRELLQRVREKGLDLFSLTDHDTAEGCVAIRDLLQPDDPHFVNGIEFSCKDARGKYHILGYGFDTENNSIREVIAFTHGVRVRKAESRFRYLQDNYGFTFTDSECHEILSLCNPGRPHFASLMMKKGYVTDRMDGFAVFEGYHSTEPSLAPENAMEAIRLAGGLPVLAHGVLADGSQDLTQEEVDARIRRFIPHGLMGVECYYATFTPRHKKIMLSLANKYDLLITAGSDYHGTNKAIALGQTNQPDLQKLRGFYAAIAGL